MDYGKIKYLQKELHKEQIDTLELTYVQMAFDDLVAEGAVLRDLPENAMAQDMLDELEDHASVIEKVIYNWVKDNFGEAEAQDPSWSTKALAEAINNVQIVKGKINDRIGDLL